LRAIGCVTRGKLSRSLRFFWRPSSSCRPINATSATTPLPPGLELPRGDEQELTMNEREVARAFVHLLLNGRIVGADQEIWLESGYIRRSVTRQSENVKGVPRVSFARSLNRGPFLDIDGEFQLPVGRMEGVDQRHGNIHLLG
jgi:hypothetical protein